MVHKPSRWGGAFALERKTSFPKARFGKASARKDEAESSTRTWVKAGEHKPSSRRGAFALEKKTSFPKARFGKASSVVRKDEAESSTWTWVWAGEQYRRLPVRFLQEDEEDMQLLNPGVAAQALLGQDADRDATQKNYLGQEEDLDEIQKAWSEEAQNFEANFATMEKKIHRFPPSLHGLKSYSTPKAVAIGPYHRDLTHVKEMQKVKKVAADHFVKDSGRPFKEIYNKVAEAAGAPGDFYDSNEVQGMGDDEFATMMFLDGCFLLQYMVSTIGNLQPSLISFFHTNQAVISEDIMLLENQLPWVVLSTLMEFMNPPIPFFVDKFVGKMGRTLQVRKDKDEKQFDLDGYSPPHLLGLLWYYKTRSHTYELIISVQDGQKPMSKATSAIELAEIGIGLKANKTAKFSDMDIKKVPLFAKFILAPLLLDQVRSGWLVNMVAFEVCMSMGTATRKQVVCSYLAILAMLMDREEDVHKLRADHIVQGELTNKEVLDFFKTVIKHISGGDHYNYIMVQLEDYKLKWWMWIIVYQFFYKNRKTIAAVLSAVGVLVGILKTVYRK